jgi:hypothetical protein
LLAVRFALPASSFSVFLHAALAGAELSLLKCEPAMRSISLTSGARMAS